MRFDDVEAALRIDHATNRGDDVRIGGVERDGQPAIFEPRILERTGRCGHGRGENRKQHAPEMAQSSHGIERVITSRAGHNVFGAWLSGH
jgi:hypothetical protein